MDGRPPTRLGLPLGEDGVESAEYESVDGEPMPDAETEAEPAVEMNTEDEVPPRVGERSRRCEAAAAAAELGPALNKSELIAERAPALSLRGCSAAGRC